MNDFWKGFKLMKPEDNEVFCIAYGSNLDETRMKKRCPSAEAFGTSVIGGYRLLGEPGEDYFDLLERGYDRWGFDKSILTKAMEDSIGRDAAALWLAEYYGEEDEHE